MPQAVEVVGEPEEQGLADLHRQAAAGGASSDLPEFLYQVQ
jgi:hypothetical protein